MSADENGGSVAGTPVGILRLEASALLAASERLQPELYERSVELIAGCTGKVILTGAGTSGIIARKIAATLTSIGAPSLFVHPSDALHGGLGAISTGDVLVAVSNSGETGELLVLLPYLEHRAVPVIAILGNLESTLAHASTIAIDAVAAEEADPLGIVPTSSSTLALAVGDALAVAVSAARGLTRESFARNHPSGRLGRRLTLRVRDVVQGGLARPVVQEQTSILDVLDAMTAGGVGAVAVVGQSEELVGLITDGDVRRALQRFGATGFDQLTAKDVMTNSPITVSAESLAYDALQEMEDRPSQLSVLPVVDGRALVGVIRLHDLVQAGL